MLIVRRASASVPMCRPPLPGVLLGCPVGQAICTISGAVSLSQPSCWHALAELNREAQGQLPSARSAVVVVIVWVRVVVVVGCCTGPMHCCQLCSAHAFNATLSCGPWWTDSKRACWWRCVLPAGHACHLQPVEWRPPLSLHLDTVFTGRKPPCGVPGQPLFC